MSPPQKKSLARPARRLTDATQLQFSAQVVVFIISAFLTVAGAMWATTYSMRSDVRDILTKMEERKKIDELHDKLQDERSAAMRESIESMKRRQELQQYEIQGLKELILTTRAAKEKP